jgi:hypothetical protein
MLLNDLDMLFSLESVTDWLFDRPEIFGKWLALVEPLQYLISQRRQRNFHIELESNSWQVCAHSPFLSRGFGSLTHIFHFSDFLHGLISIVRILLVDGDLEGCYPFV